MDMSGMSGMGAMSMGGSDLVYMQKMFWAVVGAAIACAALVNVINRLMCWQRLRAARRGETTPSRPSSWFFTSFATVTAITREIANASCSITISSKWQASTPTVGRVAVVLAELTTVIVLCFYGFNTMDQWQWEDIAYRCGYVAAAQLPLLFLLAGKNNIIGVLIGSSHERLNWLHRWAARVLFLTVTIHMAFWFRDWARYKYIMTKLKTDQITQRGFAAWVILLWIVLSSFAPIRKLSYEFFVLQHIITFIGFLAAVYLHLPSELKVWVWLSIAFYIFDRVVRTAFLVWTNSSLFHPHSKSGAVISAKATLEPLEGGFTRLTIPNPPVSWKAGQHVLLACHGISPFQSHPFTISSLPSDGQMEFLIKSKTGSTRRFYRHASKHHQILPLNAKEKNSTKTAVSVILDGPYGRMRPVQQFDSLFFIAGSNGTTFTVPLMRSVIESWKSSATTSKTATKTLTTLSSTFSNRYAIQNAATRFIRFVWVVRSPSQVQWYLPRLQQALHDVAELRSSGHDVELDINIYVTCASNVAGGSSDDAVAGCSANRHGFVEDASLPAMGTNAQTEKEAKGTTISIHSDTSSSPASATPTTVPSTPLTEETNTNLCHCQRVSPLPLLPPSTSRSPSHRASEKPQVPCCCQPSTTILTNPGVKFHTGRPATESLLRQTLETAQGETGVVACGPSGLERATREAVVRLSDERAVCKGTGALGVWFWGECGGSDSLPLVECHS